MSWDEGFAARYDEWSSEMTDDVPFYVGLAGETDGPLVELAIGNGRVAIPVARATGRTVVGIDSSPAMLALARAAASEAAVDLDLRQSDMRELELDAPAGLIYCPFRALLHLPTWVDRRRTFERVAASLRPGGRFAWNAFAFDHHVAARMDGQHHSEPVAHSLATPCPTTESTSTSMAGAPVRCGGQRRTRGLASLTSPVSNSRRSTAASTAALSSTTVASTSS